jgi:hypothetical protein
MAKWDNQLCVTEPVIAQLDTWLTLAVDLILVAWLAGLGAFRAGAGAILQICSLHFVSRN